MIKKYAIPFNRPYRTGRELLYIADCYDRGHVSGDGFYTRKCREFLSGLYDCDVLLTHSCTAALEMAAVLLDLGPGDEIVMPSFTFVSTANAVARTGATVVFADCDPLTMNIDVDRIAEAITPRTRAVVAVHYAGVACDMDRLVALCERHSLQLIEDAAQAHNSTYRGRLLGTFGAFGALSFHETKNISCGEGGALIVNRPELAARAEIIREKGTNRTQFFKGMVDKYTWVDTGSSYLPSDILAAALHAQLEEYDSICSRRLSLWNQYDAGLRRHAGPRTFQAPTIPAECAPNGHIYYLMTATAEKRDRFIGAMRAQGIYTPFHYVPLHSAPAASRFARSAGAMPATDAAGTQLVRLPLYLGLEPDQQQVISAVCQFFEQDED